MKSLDAIAASHLRNLHRERTAPWFDDDEEQTSKLVTLRAIMGPAILISPTAPLGAVRRQLLASHVPALVVIDGDALAGLVTTRDLVRRPRGMAIDAMSRAVSAPATTPIERAAALMSHAGVGTIVVTEIDGSVLGLVAALDVARHVATVAGY